jgi:hypothetical protein
LSIVLLAILAVMWAAFLLPLMSAGPRGRPGRPRRRVGGGREDGWRPARGAERGSPGQRDTPRRLARRRAALRRRRILLALTVALVAAVRTWYLLGGRWWIAEAVTGSLLLAYLSALVVRGRRRYRPARRPQRRRWPVRGRARRHAELPLWSAPLLEGQAPSPPE